MPIELAICSCQVHLLVCPPAPVCCSIPKMCCSASTVHVHNWILPSKSSDHEGFQMHLGCPHSWISNRSYHSLGGAKKHQGEDQGESSCMNAPDQVMAERQREQGSCVAIKKQSLASGFCAAGMSLKVRRHDISPCRSGHSTIPGTAFNWVLVIDVKILFFVNLDVRSLSALFQTCGGFKKETSRKEQSQRIFFYLCFSLLLPECLGKRGIQPPSCSLKNSKLALNSLELLIHTHHIKEYCSPVSLLVSAQTQDRSA